MAFISYNKFCGSEFENIVSKSDELQDLNFNQLKLEVHYTYKKDQKNKNFEAVNDEDVVNKAYLDEKKSKTDGHLSFFEKHYKEFKLQYNKQSIEVILIQRAVTTTGQKLYNKRLFDTFQNGNEVLKDVCLLHDVGVI